MGIHRLVRMLVLAGVSFAPARQASAQAPTTDLGVVEFETSCKPAVSEKFNRAVSLLHHMTYPAARAEFVAIAAADPECAMAHWGIAMTLFQPLWPTRPNAADLERGWDEVGQARKAEAATERERQYIEAVAAFFDPALTEYWDRIGRWSAATRSLYESNHDDLDARAFFALSLLASAPVSGDPNGNAEAAALLSSVLQEQPAHPGGMHYTIHADDAPGNESRSTQVVRSYASVAPRNPHALHMPTHIYVRLGDWEDAITGNELAADAALATRAGESQQWTWDEFPHAIEYLVYARLQIGDDPGALQAMDRLAAVADLEPTFKTAFHLSSIPARHALERRDWSAAARLDPHPDSRLDWSRFPWPEAVTWFARGMGAARSGDADGARSAERRLVELRDASRQTGEDLFTRQIEILRLGVAGWAAHLSGDDEGAVRFLEEAVAMEGSTPKHAVTPAPTIPATEILGDLLLEIGRAESALRAYSAALRSYPNRFNSVAGAARAARELGDESQAARFYRALLELALPDSPRPEVAEAKAYLQR